MVFQGGWRSRGRRPRPGQGPQGAGYDPNYDPNYGPGYHPGYNAGYGRRFGGGFGNRRGYGGGYGGGGTSCLRDMLLVEGGCCLAESLGCGPSLALTVPAVGRRLVGRRRAPVSVAVHTNGPGAGAPGPLVRALLTVIDTYRSEVSPRRPARCRFTPTCSHYTAQALRTHGLTHGGRLAAGRLLRCRPGAAGGPDPVPDNAAAA